MLQYLSPRLFVQQQVVDDVSNHRMLKLQNIVHRAIECYNTVQSKIMMREIL